MDLDLAFTISVDIVKDESELLDYICAAIPGAERDRGYVKLMGNLLKFEENADYDPARVDEAEGWQYFRYELCVFPHSVFNVETQRKLVSILAAQLTGIGAKLAVFSDFDA